MYQRITFSDFADTFRRHDRGDQFSYYALRALFDHLENVEEDTGEQIELDVIGLCCDYEESTVDDLINDCDLDVSGCEDDDDRHELVEKFLNKHTVIIWQRGDMFLYQQF